MCLLRPPVRVAAWGGRPVQVPVSVARQWTARFFQIQWPGLRVAIGGNVLAGLVSLWMGLYVWPVLGLFWLIYVPAVFLLTGVTIIAAYDSLVGHQRSDWTRLMWAIRRTPAVLLSGALWASLHTFGLAMFILPGLYLYVKGLLVGPAAVLDGGVAVRPFFLSKAATRGTNLSVIGLWILTVAGFWFSVGAVGTLFPASPVTMAGEHLVAFDVKLVVGVTAGLGVFPVLAPVYTRLYALNRPNVR